MNKGHLYPSMRWNNEDAKSFGAEFDCDGIECVTCVGFVHNDCFLTNLAGWNVADDTLLESYLAMFNIMQYNRMKSDE